MMMNSMGMRPQMMNNMGRPMMMNPGGMMMQGGMRPIMGNNMMMNQQQMYMARMQQQGMRPMMNQMGNNQNPTIAAAQGNAQMQNNNMMQTQQQMQSAQQNSNTSPTGGPRLQMPNQNQQARPAQGLANMLAQPAPPGSTPQNASNEPMAGSNKQQPQAESNAQSPTNNVTPGGNQGATTPSAAIQAAQDAAKGLSQGMNATGSGAPMPGGKGGMMTQSPMQGNIMMSQGMRPMMMNQQGGMMRPMMNQQGGMQPPSGQQPPTPGPGQPAMINLGNFNQDGTNKDGSPGRKMQRNSTGDAVNADSNGNAELSEQEQKVQAEFQKGSYAVFVAEPATAMEGVVLGFANFFKNVLTTISKSKFQP
jgi:hypothetical protein